MTCDIGQANGLTKVPCYWESRRATNYHCPCLGLILEIDEAAQHHYLCSHCKKVAKSITGGCAVGGCPLGKDI